MGNTASKMAYFLNAVQNAFKCQFLTALGIPYSVIFFPKYIFLSMFKQDHYFIRSYGNCRDFQLLPQKRNALLLRLIFFNVPAYDYFHISSNFMSCRIFTTGNIFYVNICGFFSESKLCLQLMKIVSGSSLKVYCESFTGFQIFSEILNML